MLKNEEKIKDTQFIQQFSSISVKNICCDLGYLSDYANILKGSASHHKIKKVRKEIEKRLAMIYEFII